MASTTDPPEGVTNKSYKYDDEPIKQVFELAGTTLRQTLCPRCLADRPLKHRKNNAAGCIDACFLCMKHDHKGSYCPMIVNKYNDALGKAWLTKNWPEHETPASVAEVAAAQEATRMELALKKSLAQGNHGQGQSVTPNDTRGKYSQESNTYPQGSSAPGYGNTGSRYGYNGGSYYSGRDPRAQYESPYQRHGYGGGPVGGRYPPSDRMSGSSYGYPLDRSYGTVPRPSGNQIRPEPRAYNYGSSGSRDQERRGRSTSRRSASPEEKAPGHRERSRHRFRRPEPKPMSDNEPKHNLASLPDIPMETNPKAFLIQLRQRNLIRQRAGINVDAETKDDAQKKDDTKKDDDVEMDGHDPRTQEIESLRAALRECKADMQRSDADLATKQKEADDALAEVARLQQDNTEGNAKLKRVNTELQQLTAQVTRLKHDLEIEKGNYSQASDLVLARDNRIVTLTNTITARNKAVRDLNNAIEDFNNTIRDARSQVNDVMSAGEVAAPDMAANGPASGQNAGPEQDMAPEQDAPTGETVQPAAGLGQVKAEPVPDLDLLGGPNVIDHKASA